MLCFKSTDVSCMQKMVAYSREDHLSVETHVCHVNDPSLWITVTDTGNNPEERMNCGFIVITPKIEGIRITLIPIKSEGMMILRSWFQPKTNEYPIESLWVWFLLWITCHPDCSPPCHRPRNDPLSVYSIWKVKMNRWSTTTVPVGSSYTYTSKGPWQQSQGLMLGPWPTSRILRYFTAPNTVTTELFLFLYPWPWNDSWLPPCHLRPLLPPSSSSPPSWGAAIWTSR